MTVHRAAAHAVAGDRSPSLETLQGQDIVCVGFHDWDNQVWTNQHHLMSRLARTNRVLFVESLGLRRPKARSRDLRRLARRLWRGLRPPRLHGYVTVVSPLVIPLHTRPTIRRMNAFILRRLVKRASLRLGLSQPILWAYVPQAEVLLDTLRPGLVVYHCVDDIAAQQGVDADSFRAAEARFVSRADLVVASSPPLLRRLAPGARKAILAPNVTDHRLFAQALEPGPVDGPLSELPGPRLVFVGTISSTKVDVDLLLELARRRRDWSLALVGPVGLGDPSMDVSPLRAQPNVHLLGPRPYEDLPEVLRGADAALIPYVRSELTDSVFPMKVYEYLAAGLPVVATPIPSLEEEPEVVTATSAEGMVEALDRVLQEDTASARSARSDLARSHDWEERLQEIDRALSGAR